MQGVLDIFDLPFCSSVVAGFDDFLYICIDRERDFFAPRMRTQLVILFWSSFARAYLSNEEMWRSTDSLS